MIELVHKIKNFHFKKSIIISFLCGVLGTLAFPPAAFPFAIFIPAVSIFFFIVPEKPKISFINGVFAGIGYFGFLLYWLWYVHPLALLGVVIIESLYWGIVFSLGSLFRKPLLRIFFIPILWTGGEFLRGWGPLAFPWGIFGLVWAKYPVWIQSASLWGIYGISFLIMIISGICFLWIKKKTDISLNVKIKLTVIVIFIVILLGIWGAIRLDKSDSGNYIKVKFGLIQGNYPQILKWEVPLEDVWNTYRELSEESIKEGSEILIWPETAVPATYNYVPELHKEIQEWISVPLILGSNSVVENYIDTDLDGIEHLEIEYYNSAFFLEPNKSTTAPLEIYSKRHLVPWGEYVPLAEIFPWVDKIVEGAGGGGFSAGKEIKIFKVDGKNDLKVGVLICFESSISECAVSEVNSGANVLAAITNDAWFGPTSAPRQHAMFSAFQAIESGVPVIRAGNTGLTCAYSARGKLLGELPLRVRDSLNIEIEVPTKSHFTLINLLGQWFGALCFWVSLFLIFCFIKINKVNHKKEKSNAKS